MSQFIAVVHSQNVQ